MMARMTTAIALFVLSVSCLLMFSGAGAVAADTYHTLSDSAQRARRDGIVVKRLAFVALWLLIFSVSIA